MNTTAPNRLLLLGICLLGLLVRLVVVWQCADATLFSDMHEYYGRAIYLRDHGQLYPDAFRPPAYPTFLTGFVMVFGDRALLAARVGQAVLGAINIGLVGVLAERLAGARGGLAAASILAVYPAWLLYPVYIMAETLFTFLTLSAIWLWSRRSYWASGLAGVALALSVQSRAVGIATIGGIVIAGALDAVAGLRNPQHTFGPDAWSRIATRLALLATAFALTLAPWVIRNAQMWGAFIPTDTASGYNFLLGNNPMATGRLEIDQIQAIGDNYWRGVVTDAERSAVGISAGMAFIRTEPRAALLLTVRKMGYLVGLEGREHAWTYSYHFHGRRTAATVWMWGLGLLISFPLVMIMALAGMFRPGTLATSLGRTIVIVLSAATVVHLASFGESRFHVPWVPLLAIMAGTLWSPRRVAPWSWPRRASLGLVTTVLLLLWIAQAPALLEQLALLASSQTPLQLPY